MSDYRIKGETGEWEVVVGKYLFFAPRPELLVRPAALMLTHALLALLRDDPGFELFVLADSADGVRRLSEAVVAAGIGRPSWRTPQRPEPWSKRKPCLL